MLYFIENAKSYSPQLLETHGLSRLIREQHRSSVQQLNGPGGKHGLLVADTEIDQQLRFVTNEQSWEPRFGHPGSWVGFWKDRTYKPQEFERGEMLPGELVGLLDGQDWLVPRLREWREADDRIDFQCSLPTVLRRDQSTGRLVPGSVVRTYQHVWEDSLGIADALLDQMRGGRIEIETDRLDVFIESVLSINYRVTLDEIGLLGLLDETKYLSVVFAALHWSRLKELAKNLQARLATAGALNESQTTDSNSGSEPQTKDGSTTTAQPSGS